MCFFDLCKRTYPASSQSPLHKPPEVPDVKISKKCKGPKFQPASHADDFSIINRSDRTSSPSSHLDFSRRLVDTNDPAELTEFGLLLESHGEVFEAELYHRHAIKLDPNYPRAIYNLSCLLRAQGRTSEADWLEAVADEALRRRSRQNNLMPTSNGSSCHGEILFFRNMSENFVLTYISEPISSTAANRAT
jgi:tetratricopeptide (TPR) repeat protein